MKTQLALTSNPIAETQTAMTDDMGAMVVFHGVVRGKEDGKPIRAIHYEANEPMARRQFELIFGSIEQQWQIESIRLTHRVDEVAVNEASLWVEVTAPHRAEAFAACQFLIDEMKQKVPIWKRAVMWDTLCVSSPNLHAHRTMIRPRHVGRNKRFFQSRAEAF